MKSSFNLNKFILASLILHVVVVAFLFLNSHIDDSKKNEDKNIEISLVDTPPEEIQDNAKIIVDSDSQAANNKVTEKAKYLSEKSNTVEKETRAKSGQKFVNAKNLSVETKAATKAANSKNTPAIKPDLFKNNFDAYSAMEKQMEKQAEHKSNQAKDSQAANAQTEASSTNDDLKDATDDLITRLNTREYKYFGYYQRIKNQLNQWWVPQVQLKFSKMMRQGRSIASDENKVTKLVIILNGAGNLVKVQVLAESGVRDLDDAAVEAFRQAAPFPNPPKGMIESDGTVKIRWDCVVES
ncbi:MAG: TonB family protein [Pseudobdellovibrio sp.]